MNTFFFFSSSVLSTLVLASSLCTVLGAIILLTLGAVQKKKYTDPGCTFAKTPINSPYSVKDTITLVRMRTSYRDFCFWGMDPPATCSWALVQWRVTWKRSRNWITSTSVCHLPTHKGYLAWEVCWASALSMAAQSKDSQCSSTHYQENNIFQD